MKHSIKILLGVLMLSVFLTACGSIESKIAGNWKAVIDDEVSGYMEIGEDRIISREESNDGPITLEYILTETEDDTFILEVVNPENGTNEFFFEGYFENKNTIKIVDAPGDSTENDRGLIRIKSVKEEMEKDEEKEAEVAAAEEKKRELENKKNEKEMEEQLAKEEEEQLVKDEEAKKEEQLAKANEKDQRAEENEEAGAESALKKQADALDDQIMNDIIESYPDAQDIQAGYYGQYYGDWDDLLNEVWAVLKDTMPEKDFERLKSEQNEWIENKEQHFDEMPKDVAYQRAKGMDYLSYETKDRTYDLIENYID